MKDTKTINVVNGSGVEGNIGSCNIQSNKVMVSDRLFTSDYRVMQINSCTGQIVTDTVYTSYVFPSFLIGAGILLGIFILCVALADN